MIKNIIFDIGNVLINFSPLWFAEREGIKDPLDRELILREIFASEEWAEGDLGTITIKEIEIKCLVRLPERLHSVARRLIYSWYDPIEPIDGMADLIREYKARGFGIYYLSNAPKNVHDYFDRIPASECFDGGIVSADVLLMKPDTAAYLKLCEKYGLLPRECFFTDDVEENVQGAVNAGMHAVRFDGITDHLKEALEECINSNGGMKIG